MINLPPELEEKLLETVSPEIMDQARKFTAELEKESAARNYNYATAMFEKYREEFARQLVLSVMIDAFTSRMEEEKRRAAEKANCSGRQRKRRHKGR